LLCTNLEYITNFIAALLIVLVDLQQFHIKTPIKSSIVGVRDFAWYRTQRRTQELQQELFLLFSKLTGSKGGG